MLRERSVPVEVLDGDEVRTHLSKGLGFSREDRDTNIRRIGYVANLLARNGVRSMTAAISPYTAICSEVRDMRDASFVEIYVEASLAVVEERDTKAARVACSRLSGPALIGATNKTNPAGTWEPAGSF